jgi:hypothetical protein
MITTYNVNLIDVHSIDQIDGKWLRKDFKELLEILEFGDTGEATDTDLMELLYMAISDLEPQEAAEIVLKYKLGTELTAGQIDQISNDMLKENVAEHYSDISFHSNLFDINVLLHKAYNGKFPHAKASVIRLSIKPQQETDIVIDRKIVLKCLAPIIDDHAIIKRLYINQFLGEEEFQEATAIIWYFKALENDQYEIITSDYWINKNHFTASEADVNIEIQE